MRQTFANKVIAKCLLTADATIKMIINFFKHLPNLQSKAEVLGFYKISGGTIRDSEL